MSGERLTSPVVPRTNRHASPRRWVILAGATAVVAVFLLGGAMGHGIPSKGTSPFAAVGVDRAIFPAFPPVVINYVNANNTTVDIGIAFNLTVNATGGTNNGSNYTYAWAGLPTGCVNDGSDLENCTPTAAGQYSVTVTVTDTVAGQHATSTPKVITVNPLPTVATFSVSKASVTVNSTIWFNVSAAGGTAPYTFKYNGLPLGCSSTSASFSCTPNRAGIYNVTVAAVDSFGVESVANLNATVTVTAAAPPTTSSGIGTTGWAVVIGILVVGAIVTVALFVQARREERAGQMGMEAPPEGPSSGPGGSPPTGGGMPPGPSS